jgi:hypothetical protein
MKSYILRNCASLLFKFSIKICQPQKQHLSQKSETGKNAELQFTNNFLLASELCKTQIKELLLLLVDNYFMK